MSRLSTQPVVALVAAMLAGMTAALALGWAVFCIAFGGPDGRVGTEATVAGVIFMGIGALFAYASYLLYVAPARCAAEPTRAIFRYALHSAPVVILVSVAGLWMAGSYLPIYALMAVALGLAIRRLRQ